MVTIPNLLKIKEYKPYLPYKKAFHLICINFYIDHSFYQYYNYHKISVDLNFYLNGFTKFVLQYLVGKK
ncbi:hypothetical protein HNR74_002380 [Flammeovirga kamogawensis]|nr:hypothetical protein [Flammeovirga kamogawensis]